MTEQFRPESTPPSESTLTLGEQLKSYRRNNRLSQIGLARLVGVSPSAICHWEKDRGFPSQRRLRAIQEVLGLPSEDKDSLNNALDNTKSSRYNYLTISMQLENSRFPLITQIPGKFDENDLARKRELRTTTFA